MQILVSTLGQLSGMLAQIGVFFAGAYLAVSGKGMTAGTVIMFVNLMNFVIQPVAELPGLLAARRASRSLIRKISESLEKSAFAGGSEELGTLDQGISMKNISFSYEEGKEVLHDVSFTVNPGESIALVGPTGAGKSTIVSLISRFYNLDKGRILIDGHDISKVTLHSLRSQMGIMLQDSFIFSGTIEDNIRYGKLDATHEEIVKASRLVCADDFISGMPDGYRSEVKERGSLLSQGQKQLISFARTLLSDPAILVLDEATSSIDVQTEKALQQGLNAMMKGRTSFVIAHRLSTITGCDKIMYIDNGGIVECGTHTELMEKKGLYYKLYNAQVEDIQ